MSEDSSSIRYNPAEFPSTMEGLIEWFRQHRIEDVECILPDLAGIARGKILPAERFISTLKNNSLRIPEAIFVQTVSGAFPEEDTVTDPSVRDVSLQPQPETLRWVPWYKEPTVQIICDAVYDDGTPVELSARQLLRKVLNMYDARGWQPIVAPELEFYLVEPNDDPDMRLRPPVGRSGRRETSRQSFGIDAVNEFDPLFEEVYDFCEAQGIAVDTLSHESGAAQMEMNFEHGEAMALADQVFLFKRTVREAALRNKVYATFMAKPMESEPGSSMHVHISVVDKATGKNIFSGEDGSESALFRPYIAGFQRYLPAMMPLLAPTVNSYRRLIRGWDAPINTHWGFDNRTVGLRVPVSGPDARRIENRLAGADVNPYLAIAASLACGLLGIEERLTATEPREGSAYNLAHTLPKSLYESLNRLRAARSVRDILGEKFTDTLTLVRETELEAYQSVISSWEREHLLLNV